MKISAESFTFLLFLDRCNPKTTGVLGRIPSIPLIIIDFILGTWLVAEITVCVIAIVFELSTFLHHFKDILVAQ